MTLQVLVSTMYQEDHGLLDRMNIRTDAVVVNQCDRNEIERFVHGGNEILWISCRERGVGSSRNIALEHATADIVLFADDDVVYEDEYARMVSSVFEVDPAVSLAVFNIGSLNPDRPEATINRDHRLRWFNCLKYGACRTAVRRETVVKKGIRYSALFGGGAKYQAGEDNLFITQCLQRGMTGIASTRNIGTAAQETSTWFMGYSDRYYHDRGALFAAMYGKLAVPLLFVMELRNKGRRTTGLMQRIRQGIMGIKAWEKDRNDERDQKRTSAFGVEQ